MFSSLVNCSIVISMILVSTFGSAINLSPEQELCLDKHNAARANHVETGSVTYSTTLANGAQTAANDILNGGSYNLPSGIGQNTMILSSSGEISMTVGVSYSFKYLYDNKVSTYDFNNPTSSTLSQVVWVATSSIGCGIALSADKKRFILVVRYQVGGNVGGQFLENVKPLVEGSTAGTTTTTESPTQATSFHVEDFDEGSFERLCLQGHNDKRALHKNTPPLTYDNKIEQEAQEWADHLAAQNGGLAHETGTPYGENLGFVSSYPIMPSASDAISTTLHGWYDNEIDNYNFLTGTKKNTAGSAIGHFTQMVWDTTEKVGCAYARNGNKVYVVAKYYPPGNYIGQFTNHVQNLA